MMKTPDSDDLRARVQDLGRHEASHAPRFDHILERRQPRPSNAFDGLRPAAALACVLVSVFAWRSLGPEDAPRIATTTTQTSFGATPEDWDLPTDGLLTEAAEAGTPEVEQLSREIEGLLKP
jgi:hypothetical protein